MAHHKSDSNLLKRQLAHKNPRNVPVQSQQHADDSHDQSKSPICHESIKLTCSSHFKNMSIIICLSCLTYIPCIMLRLNITTRVLHKSLQNKVLTKSFTSSVFQI